MNKLLSYVVMDVPQDIGEPIKVPVKIGAYVIEKVCEDFKKEFYEIGDLFETRERTDEDGNKRFIDIPKDPIRFYTSVMLHGANYAAGVEGRKLYNMWDAHQWFDQLGFKSEQALDVLAAFLACIANGGTPVRPISEDDAQKKSQ